ncbi:LLM class flavin-dependent oxidoreductase [Myxococcota bacterium]|nr:LLM class flavin-dependent oxidoreductase [Myxococcota bacterium]
MRLGLYISTAGGSGIDEILHRFEIAEELGFDTAWVGHTFDWDSLGLLCLAARVTTRIELGSWVVPTFPRHPAALAQQALTVQRASHGRLALGIGVSHAAVIEKRLGLDFSRPLRHAKAYMDVLPSLLASERTRYDGPEFRMDVALDGGGIQAPPILLAALGPRMLELAGSRAEGCAIWLGGPHFLENFAVPRIRTAAREANRPVPRILAGLPIAVTRASGARESAERFLALSSKLPSYRRTLELEGASSPGQVAIIGEEEQVGSRLDALADLGVSDFNAITFPVEGDPDAIERTRTFLAHWNT